MPVDKGLKDLGEPLIKVKGGKQGNSCLEPKKPQLTGHKKVGAPKKTRRKIVPTAMDLNNAAAMYAIGISKVKIGKILDISRKSVAEILNRPEVKEFAIKVREVIRVTSLANIQNVSQEAYDWLGEITGKKDDPKAFDYLTRGLAALEKVSSSASGENQKVSAQIEHTVSGDLSEEAKALVRALIGPKEN